ncbi:neo-calmodulin-like [Convolutriloba macropyga]|uniref:neo-calmodulin-like n=1 Tax=Convolutriloba macropyga TaxID=536237 RepID=UPI003F52577E
MDEADNSSIVWEQFPQGVKKRRLPEKWIEDKPKKGSGYAREVYQEAFDFYDRDQTGFISTDDIQTILAAFGVDPSEHYLRQLFYEVDFSGEEKLDMDQFCYVINSVLTKRSTHEELIEAFGAFDRDNDGLITAWELTKVLRVLGDQVSAQKAQQMINTVDIHKNGLIDYTKFIQEIIKMHNEH